MNAPDAIAVVDETAAVFRNYRVRIVDSRGHRIDVDVVELRGMSRLLFEACANAIFGHRGVGKGGPS